MVKFLSNLFSRATQIFGEQNPKANTNTRVGSWMQDLAHSGLFRFDPDAAYKETQFALVDGVIAEVLEDTNPGETPTSHPDKWSVKLALDVSQITTGNNMPVSASAVAAAIAQAIANGGGGTDIPYATVDIPGKARKASSEAVNEGEADDVWVSPKDLKQQFVNFNVDTNPTLQKTTANGKTTTDYIETGGYRMPAFPANTTSENVLVAVSVAGKEEIQKRPLVQLMSGYVGGGGTTHFEGCINWPLPPPPYQRFPINPGNINTLQSHRLNRPGSELVATFLDSRNFNAFEFFDIEYPDNTHYKVIPRNPDTALDFIGELKLEPK